MGLALDFESLCQPYAAQRVQGAPERTPGLQRAWLVEREKLPADIVDLAMVQVYSELAAGKTFTDEGGFCAGEHLDHHLLAKAKALVLASHAQITRAHQEVYRDGLKTFARAAKGRRRPGNILRHPWLAFRWYQGVVLAFLLGAGFGAGATWLLTIALS